MNFSEALAALKGTALLERQCIRRAGWNGKGMWLEYVCAEDWACDLSTYAYFTATAAPSRMLHRKSWIAMKTADDGIVPWLASQTDLLADDWEAFNPWAPPAGVRLKARRIRARKR